MDSVFYYFNLWEDFKMIIVLKPNVPKEQITLFKTTLEENYNLTVNTWIGVESTVLGLIGDTTSIDEDWISAQDVVESVKRVQEPYKKANRKFHPDNTVIEFPSGVKIGDGSLCIWRDLARLKMRNR